MSKPLYIFGAGGLGREVLAMLRHLPEWTIQGFYDDGRDKGTSCDGVPCLGGLQDLLAVRQEISIVLAIADSHLKEKLAQVLDSNSHVHFPVLIHPQAILLDASSIRIGAGSIITAGAILTTRIVIGEHTLINLNVTIGHDAVIGNFCSIMPGANLAGGVMINDKVLIGSGASILNKRSIGKGVRVGAGAVVTKDAQENSTVVGVPATEIDNT